MILLHDKVVHSTHKAVLFRFDTEDIWIPMSLIEEYDDSTVEVEDWFAEENELEGYEA